MAADYGETREKARPIRVSLASITSTKESIRYYKDLLNFLSDEIGRPVVLVQRNTYAETNELLRTGDIDLAFLCTYAYVRAHDEFKAKLIAVPRKDNDTTYQSFIIVRRDSGIESFDDLRGKRFAFTDPLSMSGYIYPLALLKLKESAPESFFNSYTFTYSHDNAIRAVRDGIVDGASVENLVFQQMLLQEPQLKKEIRIIQQSPDFAAPPVVARPGLDNQLENRLRQFFLDLDKTQRGKNILQNMGIDCYQPLNDSAYAPVRAFGTLVGK